MTSPTLADRPTNALINPSTDTLTPKQREAQVKRILLDLLNGWRFMTWANLTASDHYYKLVEETTNRTVQALEDGVSPYQALVLVVAPTFLGLVEPEVMVLEGDDVPEADRAVAT